MAKKEHQNIGTSKIHKLKKSVEFHLIFMLFLFIVSSYIFILAITLEDTFPYISQIRIVSFLIAFMSIYVVFLVFVMAYTSYLSEFFLNIYDEYPKRTVLALGVIFFVVAFPILEKLIGDRSKVIEIYAFVVLTLIATSIVNFSLRKRKNEK